MSKIVDESILAFSLKIPFGSSLHFVSIRIFIVGYVRNVKSHFSTKRGILVTHSWLGWVASLSHELTARLDCPFLFYSAPTIVTLQLPTCFTRVAFLRVASRESLARITLNAHTLEIFTLFHTQPLHNFHLNTGYLIAEIQANLARNKTNTWLNKFNLTISPFGYSVRKP